MTLEESWLDGPVCIDASLLTCRSEELADTRSFKMAISFAVTTVDTSSPGATGPMMDCNCSNMLGSVRRQSDMICSGLFPCSDERMSCNSEPNERMEDRRSPMGAASEIVPVGAVAVLEASSRLEGFGCCWAGCDVEEAAVGTALDAVGPDGFVAEALFDQ